MKLFEFFKPKPNKFLQLLVQQTHLTEQGLCALKTYFETPDPNLVKQVQTAELEADETRRILIEELMRTFITPFDREDIFTLSREIDDVIDYANTTVDEMQILKVEPTSFMVRMASLLHDSAAELNLAMARLQDKHFSVANEHAQRAKALENRVEAVYRESLADLFRKPKDVKDIIVMLKTREIYRHLSNAADREDEAANLISDIVMKIG